MRKRRRSSLGSIGDWMWSQWDTIWSSPPSSVKSRRSQRITRRSSVRPGCSSLHSFIVLTPLQVRRNRRMSREVRETSQEQSSPPTAPIPSSFPPVERTEKADRVEKEENFPSPSNSINATGAEPNTAVSDHPKADRSPVQQDNTPDPSPKASTTTNYPSFASTILIRTPPRPYDRPIQRRSGSPQSPIPFGSPLRSPARSKRRNSQTPRSSRKRTRQSLQINAPSSGITLLRKSSTETVESTEEVRIPPCFFRFLSHH